MNVYSKQLSVPDLQYYLLAFRAKFGEIAIEFEPKHLR
jgi:hypothetical protein